MAFPARNGLLRRSTPIVLVLPFAVVVVGCSNNAALEARDAEIVSLRSRLGTKDSQIFQLETDYAAAVARAQELEEELERIAERDRLQMERLDACTVLRLPGHVLFDSASATLTSVGQDLIGRLATVLAKYPEHEVRVEGHTDDRPIGGATKARFFSNWELSTARAASVVRYMVYGFDVAPERMVAVGYAHYRPLADNDSPEGRARNRRVELHIAMPQPTADLPGE